MASPTPTRQSARSQAARANIVRAAIHVFAERGYAAAGMDDVCRLARCSKGGLYHHFASKRVLLGAVAAELAAAGAFGPATRATSDIHLPADAEARVVLEIWAEAARDEGLRQALIQASATPESAFTAVLHAGLIVRRAVHGAAASAQTREEAA